MNRRDESGAIAVVVAVLAVSLVGMSAFVADFGLAYANKRQLQTSADASALAAAAVFAEAHVTGLSCNEMLTAGQAAAATEAAAKVVQNDPDPSTPSTLTYPPPTCNGEDLVVRTVVSDTSPQFLGGILGQSGGYTIEREATAAVEVATDSGSSGRPLGVCSEIISSPIVTGAPLRIDAPGAGLSPPPGCPVPTTPGNWWTLDCPGEGSDDHSGPSGHGNAAFNDQIQNGCDKPITIVEGQEAAFPPAVTPANPALLNTILAGACPPPSSVPYDCLSGDPGQPDAGHTSDAWEQLINDGTTFSIPIFCAPPTCATSSIVGSGSGAQFPVHRLLSVTMCGFQFISPNRRHRDMASPSPECSTSGVDAALDDLMTGAPGSEPYFIAAYDTLLVSGSVTPSTCAIGDPECDGGVRQVRLIG